MLSHGHNCLALELRRENFQNALHQLVAPFRSRFNCALHYAEILPRATTNGAAKAAVWAVSPSQVGLALYQINQVLNQGSAAPAAQLCHPAGKDGLCRSWTNPESSPYFFECAFSSRCRSAPEYSFHARDATSGEWCHGVTIVTRPARGPRFHQSSIGMMRSE